MEYTGIAGTSGVRLAEVQMSYKKGRGVRTPRITQSGEMYEWLMRMWDEDTIEYFESAKLMLMNNNLRCLGIVPLSAGGLNETLVDVRIIMQAALIGNASLIVLAHNHPSGSLRPSKDDDRLTERVKKACDIMNIKFLDHLIVTTDGYYSYNDEGRI